MARPSAPAKSSTDFTAILQESDDSLGDQFETAQLALPYHQDAPAQPRQLALLDEIPFPVAIELGAPELDARLRRARKRTARMTMPEATVHEDDLPPAREDEIRSARQLPPVEPISVAKPVDQAANGHLGARSLVPDPGHDFGAALGADRVHAAS